jgi:hypothetical protein
VPQHSNGNGGPTIPAELTGASLAQRLRGWTVPQRAVFAARLVRDKAAITNRTVKMIALETGVSVASIYIALGLSESEQLAVWQDKRPLKSATAKAVQLDLPLSVPAEPVGEFSDDAKVAAMIDQVGVDRLLEIAAAREARP